MEKYRLELETYANNLDNKRQAILHNINREFSFDAYERNLSLYDFGINENNFYDAMGDEISKYEKWLDDGEF